MSDNTQTPANPKAQADAFPPHYADYNTSDFLGIINEDPTKAMQSFKKFSKYPESMAAYRICALSKIHHAREAFDALKKPESRDNPIAQKLLAEICHKYPNMGANAVKANPEIVSHVISGFDQLEAEADQQHANQKPHVNDKWKDSQDEPPYVNAPFTTLSEAPFTELAHHKGTTARLHTRLVESKAARIKPQQTNAERFAEERGWGPALEPYRNPGPETGPKR